MNDFFEDLDLNDDNEVELDDIVINIIKLIIKPLTKPIPVQKPYSINKVRNYDDLNRLFRNPISKPTFWSRFPKWLNPEDIVKELHGPKLLKKKISVPTHNLMKQIESFDLSVCIENLLENKESKHTEKFLKNKIENLISNITNELKQYQKQMINYTENNSTPYSSIEEQINRRNSFTNKYFEYEGYLYWMNVYNSLNSNMTIEQKNEIIQDYLQKHYLYNRSYLEYDNMVKEYDRRECAIKQPIFYARTPFYIENDITGIACNEDGVINFSSYILVDDECTSEKYIKMYQTKDKIVLCISIGDYHITRPAILILSSKATQHKKY